MIELGGQTKRVMAVSAAVLICGLVAWQAKALPDPGGAEQFHRRVRDAVEQIPAQVGLWASREIPVTPAAVQLLRPNVLHQRAWVDTRTNETVTVLVVHCGDTRDLLGHYPPNCYPGQGWQMANVGNWDANLGSAKAVAVPEYEFLAVRGATTEGLWVRNAMLLPGDGLGRDMKDVQKLARKVTRRYFGAGQVQFVFPHDYTVEQRDRLTGEMMKIYGGVLEIVSGTVENQGKSPAGAEPARGATTAGSGAGPTAGEGEKREVP